MRRRRGSCLRVSGLGAGRGARRVPLAVSAADSRLAACGVEAEFPAAQVCCGQPAFTAGHRSAARRVARTFARAFSQMQAQLERLQLAVGRLEARLNERDAGDDFNAHELGVFSQWGGDGLIDFLVSRVPIADTSFVEFGFGA